jgi:hypothetical protein
MKDVNTTETIVFAQRGREYTACSLAIMLLISRVTYAVRKTAAVVSKINLLVCYKEVLKAHI